MVYEYIWAKKFSYRCIILVYGLLDGVNKFNELVFFSLKSQVNSEFLRLKLYLVIERERENNCFIQSVVSLFSRHVMLLQHVLIKYVSAFSFFLNCNSQETKTLISNFQTILIASQIFKLQ